MKFNLKPRAIRLRQQGFSISDIAKKLTIAESTVSLWCRKINLTNKQQKELENRTNRKLQNFFKLVKKQKEKRDKIKTKLFKIASKKTEKLSKRELFIAGVSLYWAEGFKHVAEGRIGFCNSDPTMMKFMIRFLNECLDVKNEEISPRLTVNQEFKDRVQNIEKFWADFLEIPINQFTKPFFQKARLVKHYEHPENYHGVLRIHVRKSSKLLLQMRGYLEGLKSFALKRNIS